MNLNLASIVEVSAGLHGDHLALRHDEQALRYGELRAAVRAVAAHLRATGIEPGDRVGLLVPNRITFTVAYFGILHAGAVVVPISFLSVGREVAYALEDSEATALVAWEEQREAAETGFESVDSCETLFLVDESDGPFTVLNGPPVDRERQVELCPTRPQDTAVILYTSGTTGQPKGAELSHFNLWSNAQYCAEKLFWRPGEPSHAIGPGDTCLAALPMFHSYGQTCNQNASIFGGAAISFLERFEPEAALEVMQRDGVTLFAGVPTMYFALLQVSDSDRHDLGALRMCNSGGAAMPVDVMKEFDERFSVQILEGYGLSETSPVATFNVLYRPRKIGSIGLPILGVEVRVVDDEDRTLPPGEVGEIVIRGPNVMKGYYNRPKATAAAFRSGWFHTGDMARADEDGYLFIVDRKKDMIIRGGFNVYPREVEEILYAHPEIREAAVVGSPCDRYGEEVKAFIAVTEAATVTPEAVVEYCKERLSATKYPRRVEVLAELPKGPTGKILRKELRQRECGSSPGGD